jgi:hypothetical protein
MIQVGNLVKHANNMNRDKYGLGLVLKKTKVMYEFTIDTKTVFSVFWDAINQTRNHFTEELEKA